MMNTPTKENNLSPNKTLLFNRQNYILMFVGIAVIVIGFILMSGTTNIMSNTKIVVAPILVLVGFIIEFFAIFKKDTK